VLTNERKSTGGADADVVSMEGKVTIKEARVGARNCVKKFLDLLSVVHGPGKEGKKKKAGRVQEKKRRVDERYDLS